MTASDSGVSDPAPTEPKRRAELPSAPVAIPSPGTTAPIANPDNQVGNLNAISIVDPLLNDVISSSGFIASSTFLCVGNCALDPSVTSLETGELAAPISSWAVDQLTSKVIFTPRIN